jgi:hypothetical protein
MRRRQGRMAHGTCQHAQRGFVDEPFLHVLQSVGQSGGPACAFRGNYHRSRVSIQRSIAGDKTLQRGVSALPMGGA